MAYSGMWIGAGAVALALGSLGLPTRAAHAQAPPATAPLPEYHPSLADMMTMAIQPRHIKLGLAGKTRNWTYLAYEASELRNGFARIARTAPTYRKQDLAVAFDGMVKDPLDRMDAAIKARSATGYDAAYAALTQSCNACHAAFEHGYVVIKAPAGPAFADQSFIPEH